MPYHGALAYGPPPGRSLLPSPKLEQTQVESKIELSMSSAGVSDQLDDAVL